MINRGSRCRLFTVANSFNWEMSVFKIWIKTNIHLSYNYQTQCLLQCLMQFCTVVWLHVKLHLVLPQAGTQSLGRIPVGFWCIITARDGEGRIQTGEDLLLYLAHWWGAWPEKHHLLVCSRKTTAPNYITPTNAQKGDLHSCVPGITDSNSKDDEC